MLEIIENKTEIKDSKKPSFMLAKKSKNDVKSINDVKQKNKKPVKH